MKNRRSFFKKIASLGMVITSFSIFNKTFAVTENEKLFIHHVFFWLKNPGNPEDRKIFEQALKEMGTIESIKLLHIGEPADTDRPIIDNTYHYSFLVGFKDRKGHDIYQEHPIHDKFRNEYSDMWTKVLVYDSVNF